jgi:hypothetical protein
LRRFAALLRLGFLAAGFAAGRLRSASFPIGALEPRSRSHLSSSVSFALGAAARPEEPARGAATAALRRRLAADFREGGLGLSRAIAASNVETRRRRCSSSPGEPAAAPSPGETTTAFTSTARPRQTQVTSAAHPVRIANRLPIPCGSAA